MLNGATQVMFEGVPTHPDPGRCWEIVDKYKVGEQRAYWALGESAWVQSGCPEIVGGDARGERRMWVSTQGVKGGHF